MQMSLTLKRKMESIYEQSFSQYKFKKMPIAIAYIAMAANMQNDLICIKNECHMEVKPPTPTPSLPAHKRVHFP